MAAPSGLLEIGRQNRLKGMCMVNPPGGNVADEAVWEGERRMWPAKSPGGNVAGESVWRELVGEVDCRKCGRW